MSKHLPYLKIQGSGGRDFSDFFCRFFEASGEDVKDVGFAFSRGFERVYIFIKGCLWGGCERVLGGFSLGLSGSNLMGARSSR